MTETIHLYEFDGLGVAKCCGESVIALQRDGASITGAEHEVTCSQHVVDPAQGELFQLHVVRGESEGLREMA